MHNDFVPFDANRAALAEYLDAHPEWECVLFGPQYAYYRHPSFSRPHDHIEIPANDDPRFVSEDRKICQTAARLINAVALGLPTTTPQEPLRRLVEITEWARTRGAGIPDSLAAELVAIATGAEDAR
ncbi:hypothetical protein [Planomonospora sp. ID82291]|uniref:hypothetical protein n=1 Tax=Planomonospora sp. ID82291 TaxID=2738136 RepID=UPI0018C3DBC6|nr:hypothetical protein [Planomonospora sp. ID82291]MBG0818936.1 hypothetical protein [Planomonospora sp. ID82291]